MPGISVSILRWNWVGVAHKEIVTPFSLTQFQETVLRCEDTYKYLNILVRIIFCKDIHSLEALLQKVVEQQYNTDYVSFKVLQLQALNFLKRCINGTVTNS